MKTVHKLLLAVCIVVNNIVICLTGLAAQYSLDFPMWIYWMVLAVFMVLTLAEMIYAYKKLVFEHQKSAYKVICMVLYSVMVLMWCVFTGPGLILFEHILF
ncbi:MAG: hypothetical protein IJ007_03875 [Oscillospiraceae bacterium]|nr:hypothetical protein [Oscillospiraceae bacterium]